MSAFTDAFNIVRIAQTIVASFDTAKNAIKSLIQSHTEVPFDFYFVKINQSPPTTLLNAVTTVDPTAFVYTFDIDDDTGFDVGNYVGIFRNTDLERFFFAEIQSVVTISGNQATVTVDTPLDFNFPAGSTVASFTRNMNVIGSKGSPQIFQVEIGSGSDEEIDITRVLIQMKTTDPATLATFGDLPVLPNGLVLRKVTAGGVIQNIWTVKDNAQFTLHAYDWTPYSAINPAQGQDGFGWRYSFSGADKHNVVVRLMPGDKLQLVIQDDLETAQANAQIEEFFAMAQGSFVNM